MRNKKKAKRIKKAPRKKLAVKPAVDCVCPENDWETSDEQSFFGSGDFLYDDLL